MGKLVIQGQTKLQGEITISGSKNSSVAILPAALMADSKVTINNLPDIRDISVILDILDYLGAKIERHNHNSLTIYPEYIHRWEAPSEMINQLRASYYLLGALLTKFGKTAISLPGGCMIGARPIDQHIKGLTALGAKVKNKTDLIEINAHELKGCKIYLDIASVGATINIMLASVKAEGKTIIENAAREPEIVDVANFLNSMGANIKGAGGSTIKISGVKKLGNTEHTVIPDRIEACTFILAAVSTNGHVIVKNVIPEHFSAVTAKTEEIGADLKIMDDSVEVRGCSEPLPTNIKTLPHPGYPTDLQALIAPVLTKTKGVSTITENIFEKRFSYAKEMQSMGANIKLNGKSATIKGGCGLTGTSVKAADLRGGTALVIAALTAKGSSEVHNTKHIDRGYENLEGKLNSLGAKVKKFN